jgi:hypothetical protein
MAGEFLGFTAEFASLTSRGRLKGWIVTRRKGDSILKSIASITQASPKEDLLSF